MDNGMIRFVEKGPKVIEKPLPNEYAQILTAAYEAGIWKSGGDYLIPNRRPGAVKRVERSDKVIWETVKSIAARAGVKAHVHTLRAAFAVQFDDANPAQVIALKELMGHSRIDQPWSISDARTRRRQWRSCAICLGVARGTTCLRRERKRHERSPRLAEALVKRPIRDSNPCLGRTPSLPPFSGNSKS
jgi:integrase-like protein